MTTSVNPSFQCGDRIIGKWNGRTYTVERLLGEGANGKVYLVKHDQRWYAMKIGFNSLDHQSEMNVLKAIDDKAMRRPLYLVDVDDGYDGQNLFSFYVMRYVKGKKMDIFMKEKGLDWLYIVGYHLLTRLTELHAQEWIFGDLKNDNVLVSEYGEVELIDFGGVSKKGQAVKQFTEVYDRGYWNLGSRKSDEAYDLFAFAILVMAALDTRNNFTDRTQILPQHRNMEYLQERLENIHMEAPIKQFLQEVLQGKWSTTSLALQHWKTLLIKAGKGVHVKPNRPWLKGMFAASLLLFSATVYMIFQ